MTEIALTITDSPSAQQREAIIDGLIGYNDMHGAPEDYREMAVLSHQAGELIGGLLGFTHWNWMFIQQLWIAQNHRGSGLGRRLVLAAEREAFARGCTHAHCDTFGFQALPFYEKLGYEIFGRLEDYPPGHTRYFLQKRNLANP